MLFPPLRLPFLLQLQPLLPLYTSLQMMLCRHDMKQLMVHVQFLQGLSVRENLFSRSELLFFLGSYLTSLKSTPSPTFSLSSAFLFLEARPSNKSSALAGGTLELRGWFQV